MRPRSPVRPEAERSRSASHFSPMPSRRTIVCVCRRGSLAVLAASIARSTSFDAGARPSAAFAAIDIRVISGDEGARRCAMRNTTRVVTLATALLTAVTTWTGAGPAAAAEVNRLSAGAGRGAGAAGSETFAKETGNSVKGTFGTAGVVRQKLTAGEPADVVIATDVVVDELAKQGAVVAGTRTDIARAGVGVGVREGVPRPDISTVEAFKQTLLSAKSIVYVDPAQGATSGIHFASALQPLHTPHALN